MAERTVPTQATPEKAPTTREKYLVPPVDIYETKEGLTVLADLPGVSKEDINVRVDKGILTIEGRPKQLTQLPLIYQEYELLAFFRQFELTEQVDQEKIRAEFKNGVVKIDLPKAEKVKPRTIPVQVG